MGYAAASSPSALLLHVAKRRSSCERSSTSSLLLTSPLVITSSSVFSVLLLVLLFLLLVVASPAHCAPFALSKMATPTAQQQSDNARDDYGDSDDAMQKDDPRMLLLMRSRRTFMGAKDDRFSLVNERGNFFLVLPPDGRVRGEKASSHHDYPAYSVLMHEVVETDCVAKHCVEGTIVKIREVTSHTYLCVNKNGHFYGKMLDTSSHVAYYSATHGSGRGEVQCNVSSSSAHHQRHRLLRHRRQATGDKKKMWQQATACRQWFVCMKKNGQLKRAQRSELPNSRFWNSSTFMVIGRHGHHHGTTEVSPPAPARPGDVATGSMPASPLPPTALAPVQPRKGKDREDKVKGRGGKKHRERDEKKRRNRKRGKGKGKGKGKASKCLETPFSSCKTKLSRGQGRKVSNGLLSSFRGAANLPFIV